MSQTRPKAVLISDIHFSVPNLEVATKVLTEAIRESKTLDVPLIIAGDLMDTKSIIRGEVANRLIDIFSYHSANCYLIVGNHDLLNEKNTQHSLNFLSPYCNVVDHPVYIASLQMYLIPYQSHNQNVKKFLEDCVPKNSKVIMHQGVLGANMGHYIQDTSSLPPETFKDYRVISGHYHKKQDIICGEVKANNVGIFSYLGSPYTISFSEAEDGPKGYSVLMDDGSLELHPVTVRKHVIVKAIVGDTADKLSGFESNYQSGDLLWVKLSGPKSVLQQINKKDLGEKYFGTVDYKLELIPNSVEDNQGKALIKNPSDILDNIINNLPDTEEHKAFLKGLYQGLFK